MLFHPVRGLSWCWMTTQRFSSLIDPTRSPTFRHQLPPWSPPWSAVLTSWRGLISSEPSVSAERGTGRLSAAQLAGLVWSLVDSHRVVRTRLVLVLGGGLWAHIAAWAYWVILYRPAPLWYLIPASLILCSNGWSLVLNLYVCFDKCGNSMLLTRKVVLLNELYITFSITNAQTERI